DLFARAVLAGVGHRVAAVAVGLGLDQRGPLLLARAVDRFAHHLAHGHEVHAVHLAARDAVGLAAGVEVLHRGGAVHGRAHAVAVVLDDVDDGQVPERAHVEGLVEGALLHRAVAEEAEADLVGLLEADPVAHARRHRQVAAHDAVAAEVAAGHVVEVHAAALAPADAGGAAAQLGHEGAHVGAARDGVPVVAVVRDDVVVVAQQAHGAHPHRLVADVEVQEAADLALDVELGAAFLEAPDEQHLAIEREAFFSFHGCRLEWSIKRRSITPAYLMRTRSTKWPRRSSSSLARRWASRPICCPFTKVPLAPPSSLTSTVRRSAPKTSVACRRETVLSSKRRGTSAARPIR